MRTPLVADRVTFTSEVAPSTVQGGGPTFSVGVSGANDSIGLLKWDFSAIPAGARVLSVECSLFNQSTVGSDHDFEGHAILVANSSWIEACNWDYAVPSSVRWAGDTGSNGGSDAGCSVAGTDYETAPCAAFTYVASTPADTEHAFRISAEVVQAWVDGANYGMVLRLASGASGINWHSDDASAAYRPTLTVRWRMPTPAKRHDELRMLMFNDRGTDIEYVPFLDADLTGGRWMSGQGSFSVPASSPIVATFKGTTVGEEFSGRSLRAFYRHDTEPIWSGPTSSATLKATGSTGVVNIVLDQFYGHFLRRRQLLATALAELNYTGAPLEADNLILAIMKDQIGPTPPAVATYPVGVSRTDFFPYSPTVHAAHGPALSPNFPIVREQSGTGLVDVFEAIAEAEDLAAVMADPLDNAFEMDVDYPYEDQDVSDDVIFGQAFGNLVDFEASADYRSLANVWCVEGKDAAHHTFDHHPGSISVRGVFEARAQRPQDTADTNDAARIAEWKKDKHGGGTIAYSATIREMAGHLFNDDWGHRSRVGFAEALFGYQFTQVVREFNLKASNNGPPAISCEMGAQRMDLSRDLAARLGTPGPREGGGYLWNKRQ